LSERLDGGLNDSRIRPQRGSLVMGSDIIVSRAYGPV